MGVAVCIGVLSVVVWVLGVGVEALIVLEGKEVSGLTIHDSEASFAPAITRYGVKGRLYLADPLDACTPLVNEITDSSISPLALIIRGGCPFDEKVRNAQKAGFNTTIIYDNEDTGSLIPMSGSPIGIKIHSVFVTKVDGETLRKYAGNPGVTVYILREINDPSAALVGLSCVCLFAFGAVMSTCCFVRNHCIRRQRPLAQVAGSQNTDSHGMSSGQVKALPTLVFTEVLDDCCTSMTCAFCLDDYNVGDRLRVLPCQHKFHASCVDSWLTAWRTFCPMCKRDVRTSISKPPASESTPLLSPVPVYPLPASALASFHSSVASSPAIEIVSSLHQTPLTSRTMGSSPASSPARSPGMFRTHSISSTPRTLNQLRSYNNSPAVNIYRSPAGAWNLSSQRSHVSYLASPHSLGHGLSPSMNLRFASPRGSFSRNGSSSYLVGSSSRPSYLRHNESASGLSAFDSAHSLPEN